MIEEFVTPKRWEGKSLKFKWKYLWSNYPEFGILTTVITVVGPLMLLYRMKTYPDSIDDVRRKYKYKYRVVRDDDPRLPEIMAEKERGRHYFPK